MREFFGCSKRFPLIQLPQVFMDGDQHILQKLDISGILFNQNAASLNLLLILREM